MWGLCTPYTSMTRQKTQSERENIMAKISKKMMATVLTASMVAALGSTSAFAEEAASDEDFSGVELNFWTAPYGDDEEAFLKEHLAAWEERTGATVNIEITPWDSYEEKMMTPVLQALTDRMLLTCTTK